MSERVKRKAEIIAAIERENLANAIRRVLTLVNELFEENKELKMEILELKNIKHPMCTCPDDRSVCTIHPAT